MPYKDPEKQRAYETAYRAAHREEAKARSAAWRAGHQEEKKARDAHYHAANRVKQNARSAAWRATHLEERRSRAASYRAIHCKAIKARSAAYEVVHPEVRRTIKARRKARMKALPATLTTEQWKAILAAYKHRCAYCGKKERKRHSLTQDHVVPVKKGGGTTANNIVPSCRSCNSKKSTQLPGIPVKLVLT